MDGGLRPSLEHSMADSASIVINKQSYQDWSQIQFGQSGIRSYYIEPDDYRAWGVLRLSGIKEGEIRILARTKDGSAIIPNYELGVRDSVGGVIIEAVDISNCTDVVLQGVTISGMSHRTAEGEVWGAPNFIRNYSKDITLVHCLLERVYHRNVLSIQFSDRCRIYSCVIRDARRIPGADNVGIAISGQREDAIFNEVHSCEIYDCTDGIQLVYSPRYGMRGDLSGTRIYNNDIYVTDRYQVRGKFGRMSCAENAIDVKIGAYTKAAKNVVRIENNRIWGFFNNDRTCGGSGGWGSGIVLHQKANNIVVRNNIIFDCSNGINTSLGSVEEPNILVENNIIWRIKRNSIYDKEAYGISGLGLRMRGNVIVDSDHGYEDVGVDDSNQSLLIGSRGSESDMVRLRRIRRSLRALNIKIRRLTNAGPLVIP